LGLPIEFGDDWPIRAGVFLIGPDGKIVAKDLHGDAIKAAVAKALAANTPSASGKHSVMSPAIHIAPAPAKFSMPATNRPGISLVIRGPTHIVKVGDGIPIELIISNHGTADYRYNNIGGSGFPVEVFGLSARTATVCSTPLPKRMFVPRTLVPSFSKPTPQLPGGTCSKANWPWASVDVSNSIPTLRRPGNVTTGRLVNNVLYFGNCEPS
jgi:hypothetical protein